MHPSNTKVRDAPSPIAGNYERAVELYTKAIELNPQIVAYYGNRSIAYLRTECYGYALGDATKAIELDKSYVKGYYRRAASNMALGKLKLSLRDFETVEIQHRWIDNGQTDRQTDRQTESLTLFG